MNSNLLFRAASRFLCFIALLAPMSVDGADAPDSPPEPVSGGEDVILGTSPMAVEAEDYEAFGLLVVDPEIVTSGNESDLVFTITTEPLHGQVGLAKGDGSLDFLGNLRSRSSYFVYRAAEDFVGNDAFGYTVRNETSGLVFQNTVVITVKAPEVVKLPLYEVTESRANTMDVREVMITTRPNTPVAQKIPSHQDFMPPAAREGITDPRVAYVLDDQAKPQHGSARLDRVTGELSYAPNPGFIGQDRFKYYTVDENNPELGVENVVTIEVEPIRIPKQVTADRSRSREVDLVFVINNSPSMAAHQDRIATNLSRFRELFHTRDLDYRIAVLTTDFINANRRRPGDEPFYKEVRSVQLDAAGNPVLDRRERPKQITKRVASNGGLVTLPAMKQPWVTPQTPDRIFAELVRVGTNGDSNRTAFTAVYNFVAAEYNGQHSFLRPDATTIVVFFMDEEETRMATWEEQRDGTREAKWVEDGRLPELISQYNERRPRGRQTLDGYVNTWVIRPFIITKGNKRGKLQMHAVVSPGNISHRRAAELTGGTVLNIESDFSAPLAALGDRIADTVAVALGPLDAGTTFYQKSLRVQVDGEEIAADPENGFTYDELTHSVVFHGAAKKKAFTAKIDIAYEEHR